MKTRFFPVIIIFLLLAPAAIAQTADKGKIAFAVLGGVHFQNLYGKDLLGEKFNKNNLILGYHAGVNVQIPIVPEFFFQPGLLFSTKGTELPEVTGPILIGLPILNWL